MPKARHDGRTGLWSGLGMMRPIGWSVVVPMLPGATPGLRLDRRWPGPHHWTTRQPPEVMAPWGGGDTLTLRALVRKHRFVSTYRACAESLASESASCLAAMDRADRHIDTLLDSLRGRSHRIRRSDIDAELSDVIGGFKALNAGARR